MDKFDVLDSLYDLVGTKFDYCFDTHIFTALMAKTDELGITKERHRNNSYITFSSERNVVDINYKNYAICTIKAKKTKGDKHLNYFGSYCDWTINGFEVTIYGKAETIEARFDEIDEAVKAANDSKAARQLELAEAVSSLMTHTGKTYYEVMNIMQEASKLRYSSDFEKIVLQNAQNKI